MTTITPTEHEKSEWSRMAQDAYARDLNDIGHRFSGAASIVRGALMRADVFNALMADYLAWLIDGFKAELLIDRR